MSRYLTIMLTDIEGFTSRVQALPREGMVSLLESHKRAVLPIVEARGGRVIKGLGDAYLIAFESPTDALLAAKEIRSAAMREEALLGPLPIRIVASAGDVNEVDGDVFGDAVNLAARLEAETPAGRIWITQAVAEGAKKSEVSLHPIGTKTFRGFSEPIQIFEAFSPEEGKYHLALYGESEEAISIDEVEARISRSASVYTVWDQAAGKWISPGEHPHLGRIARNFIPTPPFQEATVRQPPLMPASAKSTPSPPPIPGRSKATSRLVLAGGVAMAVALTAAALAMFRTKTPEAPPVATPLAAVAHSTDSSALQSEESEAAATITEEVMPMVGETLPADAPVDEQAAGRTPSVANPADKEHYPMVVHNRRSTLVEFYWVTYKGELQTFRAIPAGKTRRKQVRAGSRWEIHADSKPILVIEVPVGGGEWEVH